MYNHSPLNLLAALAKANPGGFVEIENCQGETARFEVAKAEDEHYVDLAVKSGMQYFELTDEQLAPIVAKVRAEVWPQMEPDVGKDIMDLVRAKAK